MNPASAPRGLRRGLLRERANQPGPIFPQSPGIILETPSDTLLTATGHLRSLNELATSYHESASRQHILVHSLLTAKIQGKNVGNITLCRPVNGLAQLRGELFTSPAI